MTAARRRRYTIGPCRDPLRLWYVEWSGTEGTSWRRYFGSRGEAHEYVTAQRKAAPSSKETHR